MPKHPWTPVRRFFFLQPAVWGFGLRLLVSQSFLGAKAPLDPRKPFLFFATGGLGLWLGAFGRSGFFRCQSTFATLVLPKTLRFSLQRQKAQEFCKAEFLESLPVYCFCRLCDRVLPKKQRFSLQRHKSSRILQSRILRIVCWGFVEGY